MPESEYLRNVIFLQNYFILHSHAYIHRNINAYIKNNDLVIAYGVIYTAYIYMYSIFEIEKSCLINSKF